MQDRITFNDGDRSASQVGQAAAVRSDVGNDEGAQGAEGVGQEADAGQGGEGVSSQEVIQCRMPNCAENAVWMGVCDHHRDWLQGREGLPTQAGADATVASVAQELTEVEADIVTLSRVRQHHKSSIRTLDSTLDDLRAKQTEKSQQLLSLIAADGECLSLARQDQSDER